MIQSLWSSDSLTLLWTLIYQGADCLIIPDSSQAFHLIGPTFAPVLNLNVILLCALTPVEDGLDPFISGSLTQYYIASLWRNGSAVSVSFSLSGWWLTAQNTFDTHSHTDLVRSFDLWNKKKKFHVTVSTLNCNSEKKRSLLWEKRNILLSLSSLHLYINPN